MGDGALCAGEHGFEPLGIIAVECSSEIDVFPAGLGIVVASAHHETEDFQAIVLETLHAPTHSGVGGVMAKESDTRHGWQRCNPHAHATFDGHRQSATALTTHARGEEFSQQARERALCRRARHPASGAEGGR
ncbi:MAG TPA: hypothetical protein VFV70_08720 [Hyphomonadaceae bacterium]|nr:hypothetical protein [Hyphomonadaceae bacterium]